MQPVSRIPMATIFPSMASAGGHNNFEIDGQSNNDNSIGGPQVFFGNQDAIQEIQVITNNFSAQYGRNAGVGGELHHQIRNQCIPWLRHSSFTTALFCSRWSSKKRVRSPAFALPV